VVVTVSLRAHSCRELVPYGCLRRRPDSGVVRVRDIAIGTNLLFPMKTELDIRSSRSVPLLLTLLVLFCHFPLLLNNGAYWDGWVVYGLYQNHNASELFAMFRDNGIPWFAYLHRLMWFAPNVLLAYRVTAFASILVSTLMVYSIGRRTRMLSATESVLVAAIFCTYTAYQMYFELITLPYVVCYALFLIALRCALGVPAGLVARVLLRLTSLLLFFVSFLTASFIALYGAALLLLVLHRRRDWLDRNPLMAIVRLGQFVDYLLVPFVFFYVKSVFWISSGLYATYNKIEIVPENWPSAFYRFAVAALQDQFERAWTLPAVNPVAFAALCMCVVACGYGCMHLFKLQRSTVQKRGSVAGTLALVSFCAILFAAAMLPYIVVNKLPAATGWATRNALLINLPVAVFLALLGRVIGMFVPRRAAVLMRGVVATLLVSGFVVGTWSIYLNWELRWIKDSSTIVNLRSLPRDQIERASMIWVDDDTARWHEKYIYYEYAGLFKNAWHEERRFGNPADEPLDVATFASGLPLQRYMLKDLNVAAVRDCRVTLHVRFNPNAPHDLPLVARYYWTLWFRHGQLDAFLAPLTTLHLTDFSCSADRYAHVVADLTAIRNALNAYYADNGTYPVGNVSVNDASHPPKDRWIPGLVPKYLAAVPTDPRGLPAANRQYLYMSDGRQYKIISHGSEDATYGSKARPDLVDPLRPTHAFGFWTSGFANH